MKFHFSIKYFCIFLFIFIIEVIIALYINDSIIRPYGGDVLVVILIYYFIKSFIVTKPIYLILSVLLFAYAIEVGQYFNLVQILHLQDNKIMRIIIGSSFSWGDILAYTIGAAICYFIEMKKKF